MSDAFWMGCIPRSILAAIWPVICIGPGMPARARSSARPAKKTALLLIDVINDMDFEGSESLVRSAELMAKKLRSLKRRARAAAIPTIYINDNFGKWRSDFRATVSHCTSPGVPGRNVARLLKPDNKDYFVLKPKQSAFFGTTLDTLLRDLGTKTLIVTGVAGDNCVLFSANDAYLRDFALFIPADCVASNTEAENQYALQLMKKVVKADIRPSTELDLEAMG
jgi:nicotinamidase-related amidase